MALTPNTIQVVVPSSLLGIWYQAFGIVGSAATLFGVGVAVLGGIIAYRQFKTQQESYWQQFYSQLFSDYIRVSESFFSSHTVASVIDFSTGNYTFLKELAKVIHFLRVIYRTSVRSPNSFTSVDFVLFTADIDQIQIILNEVTTNMRPIYGDMQVALFRFNEIRSKLGANITSDQEAIIQGLERQVREAAMGNSTDEEDERVYHSVTETLKTMFKHEVPPEIGSLDHPDAFKLMRGMQLFSMVKSEFRRLNQEIHQRSVEVAGGSSRGA